MVISHCLGSVKIDLAELPLDARFHTTCASEELYLEKSIAEFIWKSK